MALRFATFTLEELKDALRTMTEGQMDGVVSISHNGNSTTIYGAREIELNIQRVENEIARRYRKAAGVAQRSPMQPQNPIMRRGI